MSDKLSLHKVSGEETIGLLGSVQKDRIFLMQNIPIIEIGDEVWRHFSNGIVERYVVVDPGFYEALDDIPAHYQMTVKRCESYAPSIGAGPNIHITFNGDNARFNHQSTDNSSNVVKKNSDAIALISELRKLVNQSGISIQEEKEAQETLADVEDEFRSPKPRFRVVRALLNSLPSIASTAEACGKLLDLAGEAIT